MAFLAGFLVVVVVAVVYFLRNFEINRRVSPPVAGSTLPGPKGLPFIGNVHELPAKCSWMKFHQWAEQYGPIYQVNLAGTNHVWISRDKVAHDLLSKRSAIYSDRPLIPGLQHDNRTSGQYLPLMSKNLIWSRQRRFAKQIMDKSQNESFYSYPELESIRLLFELMTNPSKYNEAMESYVARVTSRLAWGTSKPAEELKQRARELLIGVSPSGALGNKLPFIMSLPQRLVKAKAWELRRGRTERKFFESMQEEVQREAASEMQPKQSWTRMFLENQSSWGFASPLEGAYAVGMHGIAGALTIAAPMQSFCLAMCHYPQYQPVLHDEIDRVLGDRMPTYSDMSDMPVLRAFIRETLRWRPPVPTGIPHELSQDDVYEGYHIPAGSVVHPLEWSISRDPEVFPDPDAWNPLRWLKSEYPTYQEPLSRYPTVTQYSQFGYGRRTCQGMGVTEADLFVGLGSVSWLFSMQNDDTEGCGSNRDDVPVETVQASANLRRESLSSTSSDSRPNSRHMESERPNTSVCSPSKLMMLRNDSAVSIPASISTAVVETTSCSDPITERERAASANDCDNNVAQCAQCVPEVGLSTPPENARLTLSWENDDLMKLNIPGSWNLEEPATTQQQISCYEADPTMNFSTLLIAKPMPFKFNLRIRNQARAKIVAQQWIDQKMGGEFEDAKVYWKGGANEGDAEFGWGETFA